MSAQNIKQQEFQQFFQDCVEAVKQKTNLSTKEFLCNFNPLWGNFDRKEQLKLKIGNFVDVYE